jgi:hypothetical protein
MVTRGNPMIYTYSWSLDGTILSEISATLTLTSFSMDKAGNYTCVVMNGIGSGGRDSIIIVLGG